MSTKQPEPAKKTGRPAKPDADKRSAPIRIGIRDGLRKQLDVASIVSGRSLGEELELRLENSVKLENLHRMIFSDGPSGEFMMNVARGLMAINEYEISPGQRIGSPDWQSSDATRAAIRSMMQVLVNGMVPPPRQPAEISRIDPTPWTSSREEYYNQTLNFMKEAAAEMAKRMLGQSEEEMRISDPKGASSH